MNPGTSAKMTRVEGVLLLVVVLLLGTIVCFLSAGQLQSTPRVDLSLRNPNYPTTYISRIDVDLTSPHHWVQLVWAGDGAADEPIGPFHSSPGKGAIGTDCDSTIISNHDGSNCTPKGTFTVAQLDDCLDTYPDCKFVTVIDIPRDIALHSHWDIPEYPASHGCIRLDESAAQLIHNNSIVGTTSVNITGTWSRPPDSVRDAQKDQH